jgi:hypothetical protein
MSSNLKVSVSKRKLLLAFFSIALICSLASGSIMYVVAQGGSTPITISSGPYPGATSNTFYVEGSIYYSKTSFGVVSSSIDCSSLWQTTFDLLGQNGGTIFVQAGNYTLNTAITINGHITLAGEYDKTIIIESLASGYLFSFGTYGTQSTFKDLYIIGTGTGQFFDVTRWGITLNHVFMDESKIAVRLETGGYIFSEQNCVTQMLSNGIGLLGDDGADTNDINILNCEFTYNNISQTNTTGIVIGSGYKWNIDGGNYALTRGIYIRGGNSITIKGIYAETTTESGAVFVKSDSGYGASTNVEITNVFVNSAANNIAAPTYAFSLGDIQIVSIKNCHLLNGYKAINLLSGAVGVTIEGIYNYNSAYTISVETGARLIDITSPINYYGVMLNVSNSNPNGIVFHGPQFEGAGTIDVNGADNCYVYHHMGMTPNIVTATFLNDTSYFNVVISVKQITSSLIYFSFSAAVYNTTIMWTAKYTANDNTWP